MNDPGDRVLDSYALLAYLENEAGALQVKSLLSQAETGSSRLWMSIVNLGEVLYITERERGLAHSRNVLATVEQLPVDLVIADRAHTLSAAHIKARFPLSYADAFAAALAQTKSVPLVTGDEEFSRVESLVAIEWLPKC